MADIITASQVSREYVTGAGSVFALRDVSAVVQEATLTIFKGRSGSGKTTLLNIVGALDRPTAGSVIFDGKDIARLSEKKRDAFRRKHIGFVFQSVALIGQMTAYENIEFALRISGMGAGERRKRVIESLERVGLGKRMHHRPSELSGGEQQRVAIARAIAHRPRLVLADEPTAELDTKMGIRVVQLFRELVQIEGITVIMSTHDPNMMELGDRVYTLDDGQVVEKRDKATDAVADASAAPVKEKPAETKPPDTKTTTAKTSTEARTPIAKPTATRAEARTPPAKPTATRAEARPPAAKPTPPPARGGRHSAPEPPSEVSR